MTEPSCAPAPTRQALDALRQEVRAFLAETLGSYPERRRALSWMGFDPAFSRKLGSRGWIGMTWPKRYGGHERHSLERYVVLEELLAAGAPVAAHWIADRQSGPTLLRFGSEAQREAYLPAIARGECYFCIGMSEADSGSDLASVRTRAVPVAGGWRVNGAKLWTTYGHEAQAMILYCRTGEAGEKNATSQFVVDMKNPGVTIRPIYDLSGAHHFNEVVFEDALLPEGALIGKLGQGWTQVTSELSFERSGPDRFLSSFALLRAMVGRAAGNPAAAPIVGRLVAHLVTLRGMSRAIAELLEAGANPMHDASIVKDLGTAFEQDIVEQARLLGAVEPDLDGADSYAAILAQTTMSAPSFSLRGGTREIIRGIVARGVGL